jgi:hypothetical protein
MKNKNEFNYENESKNKNREVWTSAKRREENNGWMLNSKPRFWSKNAVWNERYKIK